MNAKTIEIYHDTEIAFRSDAWVNATQMAKPFGKLPASFTRTDSAKAFITALEQDIGSRCENLTLGKSSMQKCIVVQNGGACPGTWMHPDLALEFARWLSPEFAIWCNRTIRRIMAGDSAQGAWAGQDRAMLATCAKILADTMLIQDRILEVVENIEKAQRQKPLKAPPSPRPLTDAGALVEALHKTLGNEEHAEVKTQDILRILRQHRLPVILSRKDAKSSLGLRLIKAVGDHVALDGTRMAFAYQGTGRQRLYVITRTH